MKIVLVSNTAWSIWNFRRELILLLLAQGHEVWVFAPEDEYVASLQKLGCSWQPMSIEGKGKNPLREWRLYRDFVGFYREQKFAFAIHYTIKPVIYGSIAARRAGVRTINVITGLGDAFQKENWLCKLVTGMYRYALRGQKTVFFLNQENADVFTKKKILVSEQLRVLPGEGVDLAHFAYALPITKESIRFLFIGRVLREKGAEILWKAFCRLQKEMPHRKMELVYQGFLGVSNASAISEAEMNRWTAQNGVVYKPATSEVRSSIAEADCVVLPSYYGEGVPRSLLEAAALGRAIITTDHVGCREVVRAGETGFLCRPKDVESLVETMQRFILLSCEERETMGKKGRKLVEEKFSVEKVLQEYSHILESA